MRKVDARIPTGGTPTRTRHESAVVPPNILTQRPHKQASQEPKGIDPRSLSPNKLQTTKKPVISPKIAGVAIGQNFRSKRSNCSNHPDRQAEFRIVANSEIILYCQRCATHLASQNFKVQRLQQSKYKDRKTVSIGSQDRFQGHPRAAQIADFLQNMRFVEKSMRDNNRALMDIQPHYTLQIRQLEEFYNGIVCYINYIRNEQVGMLKEECRRYVQMGLIEYGTNEDNLGEINIMASDIEEEMETIVTRVSEDHFKHVLNEYNKNLEMYRHRLEEQSHMLNQLTNIRNDELQAKLEQFKRTLCELLGVKEQTTSNHFSFEVEANAHFTMKRNHHGKENRNPFRNLFGESNELPCPDESPHFKPF